MTVLRSPDGKTFDVDPRDEAKARAQGWTEPARKSGGLPDFPSVPVVTPWGAMQTPDRAGVAGMLPTFGAMTGGALGGLAGALTTPFTGPVGAPAGDVLGSAGGAYLGDMGSRAMLGQPQDPAASGKVAAANGALALGGNLAAPLVRGAGNMLVRQGYKSAALAGMFPGLFKSIEEARIPVGSLTDPTARTGTAKASAGINAGRNMKNAALAADASTHPAESLARDAIAGVEAREGRKLTAQEAADLVAKVKARADELLGESSHGVVQRPPGDYNAREVDQIRMRAQSASKPGYRAAQNADWKPQSELDEPMASSARSIQSKNPTLDEALVRTRKAIGVRKAVGRAELRPEPDLRGSIYPLIAGSTAGHFIGGGAGSVEGGVGAALLHRALADPRIASRLGFALNHPATVAATRVAPRFLGPMFNGEDGTNVDPELLDYLNSTR